MVSRSNLVLAALFAAVLLSTAACSSSGMAPAAADRAGQAGSDGAALFRESCGQCHGNDAKGRPHVGPDLTANEFVNARSDQDLLVFIKEGRAVDDPDNTTGVPMPPKGGNSDLTDEQLLDIIDHIRSLAEEQE